MPDIFDTLESPRASEDVFDSIAPSGDVFDEVAPELTPEMQEGIARGQAAALTAWDINTLPYDLDWSEVNKQKWAEADIAWKKTREEMDAAEKLLPPEPYISSEEGPAVISPDFDASNQKREAVLAPLRQRLIAAEEDMLRYSPKASNVPSYAEFAKGGGFIGQYTQKYGVYPTKQEFAQGEVAAGRRAEPNAWETAGLRMLSSISSGVAEVARTIAPSFPRGAEDAKDIQDLAQELDALSQLNRGAGGSVGRGVGNVVGLIAGNPAGKTGILAGASRAAADAKSQVLASGGTKAEAEQAAKDAFLHMGIYMGTGMVAGRIGASMAGEGASALRQGVIGGAAATGANIGTSLAMTGGNYGLENLTQDVLFGGMAGAHAFESARNNLRPLSPDELRIVATEGIDALNEGQPRDIPIGPQDAAAIREPSAPVSLGGSGAEGKPSLEQIRQEGVVPPDPNRELGPGAANIEEFGPQATVGAKNASVDAQRAERGLPPLMSEARKADAVTWGKMEEAIEVDAELPSRLTEKINKGEKKSITDEEQSMLLWRMIDLRNKRDMEGERMKDESLSPEEQAAHVEKFNDFEKELQKTEEADRKIGTQSGRALRIRRLMANEDFTLATMEARVRSAKGEPLTPEETARIKTEHDEIARLAKEQGKREAQLELEAERKAIEEKIAEVGKYSPGLLERARKWIEGKEAQLAAGRERAKILVSKIMGKASANPLPIGEALELTKILANEALVKLGRAGVDLAKFSSDMVSQFGEAVSPYLKKAWEMAQREWNASPSGTRKKTALQAREEKDATKTAVSIEDAIKASASETPATLAGYSKQIKELAREYVKAGADTVEKLEAKLHAFFEPLIPGVTPAELRNEFSDYGKSQAAPTEPLKVRLSQLRQEAQKVSQLEALEKQMAPLRTGQQRVEQSDRARDLTKKINELKKQLGIVDGDPAKRLRSALEATQKRLENAIADARYEMAKGQRSVKTKTPPPTNEKIEALRAELKTVRAERDALLGPREITEAQLIAMRKRVLQRQIEDTQERIDKGDFEPRKRKPPLDVSKDPEAVRLSAEAKKIKDEFNKRREEYERAKRSRIKKLWDGVTETLATSRSLITSADVSAPFRQGGFLLLGDLVFNPVRAGRQLKSMFQQLVSEKGFENAQAAIMLRPNAKSGLYERVGLYFADMKGGLSGREESMRSNLAEKIPLIKKVVRASNRAYVGFLNRQRADSFDAMIESLGGPDAVTPEQAKAIADFVNTATGRGSVAGFERSADAAARILFSPRFLASRFQLIAGQHALTGPVKALVAQQYGKFALGLAAVYGLSQLFGSDVEKDPRSADFGKAKFGNTRIDPLAGLAQVTTFLARELSGQTKKGERVVKQNRGEAFTRFARTKLAPIPGAITDFMVEKTLDYQDPSVKTTTQRLLIPISYQDMPDVYREHGAIKGTIMQALNLMGMGLQHYDSKK